MTSRPSQIRRRRERLVAPDDENPWVSSYYDEVEWPDGRTGRYNRIVESGGRPGVGVLPICPEGIGLVLLDRYPIGQRVWEMPRGFGESEDPAEDARRELREETGWEADSLVRLGSVHLNSGLLAGAVEIFAATVTAGRKSSTDGEAAEVRVFPIDEVHRMIRAGELQDSPTLSALLLARTHGVLAF